jgi:hypothetical protein
MSSPVPIADPAGSAAAARHALSLYVQAQGAATALNALGHNLLLHMVADNDESRLRIAHDVEQFEALIDVGALDALRCYAGSAS